MAWTLEYSDQAIKQLSKLDRVVADRIDRYLAFVEDKDADPRQRGTALVGDLSGRWRYRVGGYRVLCSILDEKLIVLVLTAEKRETVYNRKRHR
ncbi:type II toxin-antitoxin system RelE/ParE family toxin [Vulcanococcus limneticus Candia 3F8]|uniref:type II toxin-antitoxin system RelE family toxin n=1 Tax=Vulcanococcus limneticus TaxID=2170428 RepID=UPI0020CC0DF6|nr:type II toxin-antitoxin system RelE/ParE family toxin [Vulcanococcus limneticus]MCP9793332.1 type II toxin-antitoxin system RelE/ParE family toxin [Vulcanococcus limneticus MW73D5]MCP9895350.1 type II toxin-antitoxin system RelE/ParE family toxin [Vulcanococcus limneticus Candia 3F8]MCP9898730.1 type II toxin-antitoxin system RelE/ParE family toxin [Vulcanococcus limneticus Candia 3B3]